MINAVGYIRISALKVHVFHLFYFLGFLFGFAAGLVLADILHLQWWVISCLFVGAIITFFSLVKLVKQLTGIENIVYYHHEICILLVNLLMLWLMQQPVFPYLDITIIGIGIFNMFGRGGCFFVGCCHGKPSAFGVTYHYEHVKEGLPFYYENVRLLPVQLIESFGAGALVIGCVITITGNNYLPGEGVVMYSVLYGAGRFILELFRGDHERGYFNGLSEAQWTTLIILTIITVLGFMGILPLYNWHLAIDVLVALLALVLLLLFMFTLSYRYFNPEHIHELAVAIREMRQRNQNFTTDQSLDLCVYTTRLGITVSYSCDMDTGGVSYIYAVSADRLLTRVIAGKLAKHIRFINRYHSQPEVLYDGNWTYYFIFEENNINIIA